MNTMSKIKAEESKEKEEMNPPEEEEEEEDKENQKAKPPNNKPQSPKSPNKLLERVLCSILFNSLSHPPHPSYPPIRFPFPQMNQYFITNKIE